jgi:hypothetical protein
MSLREQEPLKREEEHAVKEKKKVEEAEDRHNKSCSERK